MAEIVIQSVKMGRFRTGDFIDTGGARVYYIKYDIPGLPQLDGHVHTIPAAALANHRIATAEQDPMVAMEYYLQETMTNIQTARVFGTLKACTREDSPVRQAQLRWMGLVDKVNKEVETLSKVLSVQHVDELPWVQADIQEIVTTPVWAPQPLATIKTPVLEVASRLGTAQEQYLEVQAQPFAAHPVDTSVRPWGTLRQMLADDTEELAAETDAWFDYRYGVPIRQTAGYRLKED